MIKSKIISLMLVICGILSFNIIEAKNNELPLLGKVIYIDPGHGRYYYTKTNINTC